MSHTGCTGHWTSLLAPRQTGAVTMETLDVTLGDVGSGFTVPLCGCQEPSPGQGSPCLSPAYGDLIWTTGHSQRVPRAGKHHLSTPGVPEPETGSLPSPGVTSETKAPYLGFPTLGHSVLHTDTWAVRPRVTPVKPLLLGCFSPSWLMAPGHPSLRVQQHLCIHHTGL